jgi:hypothetical protein
LKRPNIQKGKPYTHKELFDIVNTSVACAVGPSVTTSSTDFSFQILVFWYLFEFLAAEITEKLKSPTF